MDCLLRCAYLGKKIRDLAVEIAALEQHLVRQCLGLTHVGDRAERLLPRPLGLSLVGPRLFSQSVGMSK